MRSLIGFLRFKTSFSVGDHSGFLSLLPSKVSFFECSPKDLNIHTVNSCNSFPFLLK